MTTVRRAVPPRCRATPAALPIVAAVMAALMSVTPVSLRAQTTEEVLIERRLEYAQALAEHEAAQRGFEVVERRFSFALNDIDRARRGGDQEALEQAYAVAQERSLPVRDRRNRVMEASARLEVAMDRSGGSIKEAAELLGLSYKTLQYRLKKHAIDRD